MADDVALDLLPRYQRRGPRPGMIWIQGGVFRMGSDRHYAEEAPERRVSVDGFWIDACPVTNRQFARFVDSTGWRTTAERPPVSGPGDGAASPGGGSPASMVFTPPRIRAGPANALSWWLPVAGADWRHPAGPDSSLRGLEDHPVVHVSWEDVSAYAAWAGVDLPSEAEWEYACRGGLVGASYAWGEDFMPEGRRMANTWQGEFPFQNLGEDGWLRTSPVGAFPANGYGLSDMIGNVWEWTRDWWSSRIAQRQADAPVEPSFEAEYALADAPRRVVKGGSHLSAFNYCPRYRPAARQPQPVDAPTSDVGFRCVVRPSTPS
jgi:formylglycine-generating enzyme required for sulfatase activity